MDINKEAERIKREVTKVLDRERKVLTPTENTKPKISVVAKNV